MDERKHRKGPLDLVTWLVRTGAPAALHAMGLGLVAGLLEEHAPMIDSQSVRSALDLVRVGRASVETLERAIDGERMGDAARGVEDAANVLGLVDGALVAAIAYAMGVGSKTSDLIQDACLRVQAIASRWGKDVPPPTMPSPTESEREKPTARGIAADEKSGRGAVVTLNATGTGVA